MEPQPVADQPSISPVIPTTKPKNRIVLLIGGIIILCVGIGIGLFFSKNLSPISQTSPTPTQLPTAIIDPTANWKTYSNEFWGITFRHPDFDDKCCGISGAVTSNPVMLITLADSSTVVPNTDAPFDGIALYGIPNNGNLSLDQYVEKEKAALLSDFKSMADPGQINQGVTTKTSVNGLPATVLSNYSWDGIVRTYFKSNNNSFIFEISKKEKFPNHFVSFDQILSTFRFIDQATISNSCIKDTDCGMNICDCKADLNSKIKSEDKICTRYCPGTPKCINNICQLVN